MLDDPLNEFIILVSGHGEVFPVPELNVMAASTENTKVEISALFIA